MTKTDWPAIHDRAVMMWARGDNLKAIAAAIGVNSPSTLGNYMRNNRGFFPKRNRSFGRAALQGLHGQIHARLSETGRLSYPALRTLLDVTTDQLMFILRPALEAGQLIKDPYTRPDRPIIMAGEHFAQIAASPPARADNGADVQHIRPSPPAQSSNRRAQVRAAIARNDARIQARYGRTAAAAAHDRRAVLNSNGWT